MIALRSAAGAVLLTVGAVLAVAQVLREHPWQFGVLLAVAMMVAGLALLADAIGAERGTGRARFRL